MSTRVDTGAAGVHQVAARELALEVAALIGRETFSPLLDARQAAVILNVPPSWIAAEARAGRIPHVRLGRYVRFNRDELMRGARVVLSDRDGRRGRGMTIARHRAISFSAFVCSWSITSASWRRSASSADSSRLRVLQRMSRQPPSTRER